MIAHRYRLRERLGAGRAEVYAAVDVLDSDRVVALKLAPLEAAAARAKPRPGRGAVREQTATRADTAVRNLWREFELLRGLGEVDAGFVNARDIGIARDSELGLVAWLAVDLVDGETLAALLRGDAGQRPPLADVIAALQAVLRGVATLHACNLTHGDIKAANVMIPRQEEAAFAFDRATLIDLELAAKPPASTQPPPRDPADTQPTEVDGAFVDGTLAYLAPERLDGSPPSARADVYAFGALACYALTGRLPVAATDEITTRKAHRADSGHRLSTTTPAGEGIPEPIRTLLSRCVANDPLDRPVDAGAALEQWTALATLDAPATDEATDEAAAGAERVVLPLPISPLVAYAEATTALARWLGDGSAEHRTLVIVGPDGAGKRRVVDEAIGAVIRDTPAPFQRIRIRSAAPELPAWVRGAHAREDRLLIEVDWPSAAERALMSAAARTAFDELFAASLEGDNLRIVARARDVADLPKSAPAQRITLPTLTDGDVVTLATATLGLDQAELPHAYRRWLLALSPRTPGRLRDGLAHLLSPPSGADASGAFLYRAEGRWQFAAELDPAAVRLEPTPWVMPPMETLTVAQARTLLEQAKTIADSRDAPDDLDDSLARIADRLGQLRGRKKKAEANVEALIGLARHQRGRLAMRRSEWATAETFIGPTVDAYRSRLEQVRSNTDDGDDDDDDDGRARVTDDLAGALLDYASVAEGQGHTDDIQARLTEAEALTADLTGRSRDRLTARANELRARMAWIRGDYAAALAGVEAGVRACEALDDARGIAIAHANRGLMLHLLNREDEADAAFAEAERRYRQLGLRVELSIALNSRSALQLAQGRFAAMRRSLREALRLTAGRDRLSEVVCRCNLAAELMIAGDVRDAQRVLGPVSEVAGATDDALVRAIASETAGEWAWRCADVDGAVEAWTSAAEVYAAADLGIYAARVAYRRALALALIGRVRPAREAIASVTDRQRDEVAGATSDAASAAVMFREMASAICEFGDGAWALTAARVEALLHRDATPALSQADLREALPLAVRIWMAMGRYADALRDLVRAQSMPGLVADSGPRATLDLLGAELAWYRCDPARALTLFHSARDTIHTLRARAHAAAAALALWDAQMQTVALLLRVSP